MGLDQGYDTLCKPEIFSQGQWQLCLSQEQLPENRGSCFDEITANLDADTEEMVLRALKSASEGRTVISISHRVYQRDAGRGSGIWRFNFHLQIKETEYNKPKKNTAFVRFAFGNRWFRRVLSWQGGLAGGKKCQFYLQLYSLCVDL